MSVESGVIPDPGGGGELKEDGAPQVSEASRKGKERRAAMTEAEKAAHSQKIRDGIRRKKEREEGRSGGDRPPRAKASRTPPADTRAADLLMIREMLANVLMTPSVVGAMRGDAWLTSHFTTRGPRLADAIVEEAARNDAFRAYLLRIAKATQGASLIGAVAMYVLPPLMHFGIAPGAELLGVPVVEPPLAPGAQAPPVPGRTPQFVAPERGPARVVPEPPAGPPLSDDQMRGMGYEPDDLAAELAEHEEAGGIVPPLPMEPV
jgi:hypothetical protein